MAGVDISGSTGDLPAMRFTATRCANNQDKTHPCWQLFFAYCRQCFKEVFYWNSFPGLWAVAPDYRYPILPRQLAKFSVHPFPICPPRRYFIPVECALQYFGCQEILARLNELNKLKTAFLGQCWHSRSLYLAAPISADWASAMHSSWGTGSTLNRGTAPVGRPWINRRRRLAKDYENLNRTAIAFIRLASISLMLRRLTRYCYNL